MRDVELELRDLSAWVDWPEPAGDLADRVVGALGPRRTVPRVRVLQVAAAVVVALLAVVVAAPDARRAVADWLGLAAVRITLGDERPPVEEVGATLDLGRRVSLDDVDVAVPGALGRPDEVWQRWQEVSLVWRLPSGVVLLTVLPDVEPAALTKEATAANEVRVVDVGGARGWWIGGPHLVRRTRPPESARAANVLLWSAGGVAYRLELPLDLDDALRIATSLR